MPRKPFVPGAALVVAAALAAGLTACTGGSGSDGEEGDAKSGGTSTSSQAAEPGRYQTLPEACGLPARSSLRGMLPGDGQQLSRDEAKKIYDGQPDITYDTDRRVGCHWTRETTAGTRHLSLDIQRVVSYNAAVSDDSKAQGIYDTKAVDAKIPSGGNGSPSPVTPSPSATKDTSKDKTGDKGKGTGTTTNSSTDKKEKAPSGSPSGSSAPATDPSADPSAGLSDSTAPRVLDDLGDAAFLNDKLVTADSGVHRDVTVVFRTSNVIVTLTYDQWSTDKTMLPESQELQDKARSLAGELSESLSE
ncbi:hypothetical protein QT196_18290 [Streptomyces sp. P9-2B-2]|uniref:hypothetical protein n=1 Tax=Streptomyces TaxID=1883 RepID=UPI00225371D3|nr:MULTISPECIES: hypothetical protein [Streptomyces]MCX4639923.1 hypothetical protein [Streptomyces platensis]WJY39079.1 hypothetical protein QT196_18290 [Streptomyces sp. P9-2B-2]